MGILTIKKLYENKYKISIYIKLNNISKYKWFYKGYKFIDLIYKELKLILN